MKKTTLIFVSLIMLVVLAIPTAAYSVNAYSGIPTFTIVSNITDQKVTILTSNFPANYDFQVMMGAYGTLGVGGTLVATTNSGTGGAFQATYTIPAVLAGSQRIAIRMQSTTGGFFAYNWFWNNTTATGTSTPPYSGFPTFSVSSVVVDTTVTVAMLNLPANYTFNVLMGAFGTLGIGGTQVASFNSGTGGSLSATYNIPAALKGAQRIAIRIQSTTGGFFAYNWFWNNTSTSTTGGTVYTGIPTFTITSVVVDSTVTISAVNFPANYTFNVLMGTYGTLGVGGTLVATFNSGTGGNFSATYNIPAALKGAQRIAIRLDSTTGGFFAYNWFWNNTSTSTTGGTTYSGIPTFAITTVVKDTSVTISATNFPPNYDFVVLMGAFGTLGVGGTQVATFNSGVGGNFSATYTIPAGLKGSTRIAIRLQSTTGGFFAYNWFWNA
jgi:3-methyladenine DNA glycosylase Tag